VKAQTRAGEFKDWIKRDTRGDLDHHPGGGDMKKVWRRNHPGD
jgi:hypothetical protein